MDDARLEPRGSRTVRAWHISPTITQCSRLTRLTENQRTDIQIGGLAGLAAPSPDGRLVAYVTFEPRPQKERADRRRQRKHTVERVESAACVNTPWSNGLTPGPLRQSRLQLRFSVREIWFRQLSRSQPRRDAKKSARSRATLAFVVTTLFCIPHCSVVRTKLLNHAFFFGERLQSLADKDTAKVAASLTRKSTPRQ